MTPSEEAVKAALLKWWMVETIEAAGYKWSDDWVVQSMEEMRDALAVAYQIDKND